MTTMNLAFPWIAAHPPLASLLHGRAGHAFDLAAIDPRSKPLSNGKEADLARFGELAAELDTLQEVFYADHRFKLLVVLQGMDSSGKDGTVRGVFGRMNALGVRAVSWKAPTDEEKAHDMLWRIHARVPAAGEVVLFNRSHYEDVLVPVVNGWIDGRETKRRYQQINDFERMLTETGTVILKFLLHISRDEQRKRLQARADDPAKRWKFNLGDLEARKQWDAYQRAYADAVSACGTSWAPWIIVPADSKIQRNLLVATVVAEQLRSMGLAEPPGDPALDGLVVA